MIGFRSHRQTGGGEPLGRSGEEAFDEVQSIIIEHFGETPAFSGAENFVDSPLSSSQQTAASKQSEAENFVDLPLSPTQQPEGSKPKEAVRICNHESDDEAEFKGRNFAFVFESIPCLLMIPIVFAIGVTLKENDKNFNLNSFNLNSSSNSEVFLT